MEASSSRFSNFTLAAAKQRWASLTLKSVYLFKLFEQVGERVVDA